MAHIPSWLAFTAGLLSFLSPCVLPLVPAYIAYLGGRAADPARARLVGAALAFVVGLSAVFVLFFYAFHTLLFGFLPVLRVVAAILVLVLALHTAGLVRFGALLSDFRLMHTAPAGGGLAGGLLLGAGFATGWTPCIGPTLAVILTAGETFGPDPRGLGLTLLYCAGLGLPFLLLALLFERARAIVAALNRRRQAIDLVSAAVLAGMAVLLLTDQLARLAALGSQLPLPGWMTRGV